MKNLQDKFRLSIIINCVLLCTVFLLMIIFVLDHNKNIDQTDYLTNEMMAWKETAFLISDQKDQYYAEIKEDNVRLSEDVAILTTACELLSNQSQSLYSTSEKYYNELTKLEERKELYDKYEYAIINDSGKRTDITYDQIIMLEKLVANTYVNDPNLYLSWIMTESKGIESAKNKNSSAKGYGQFLDSTSQFVWTKLMKNDKDEWSSSISLDGNTNIEMMVTYVNYLFEKNNGNLYTTIDNYRGLHKDSYVQKINKYLVESGTTLEEVSSKLKDQYNNLGYPQNVLNENEK